MKSIFTFLFSLIFLVNISAQLPAQFNYQAIARNNAGIGFPNQAIKLRFTIHDLTATGIAVYSETRTAVTSATGLFTVAIGGPGFLQQSGSIDTIKWVAGPKFMQVEIDPTNGGSFTDMGTTQLLSVPFALQSSKATALNLPWTNTGQAAGMQLMTDRFGEANWEGGIAFSAIDARDVVIEIPGGYVPITVPFSHVNYDVGGDFISNGSLVDANTFIVPKDGIYHFEGAVRFSNFAMENGHVFLRLHIVHSSGYGSIEVVQRASTYGASCQISHDIFLTKGTKMTLQVAQNTLGAGYLGIYSSRFSGRFVMNK